MEAVNLLSSNKYTEKQIVGFLKIWPLTLLIMLYFQGYLFISVLVSSNSDLIKLIIQNIKVRRNCFDIIALIDTDFQAINQRLLFKAASFFFLVESTHFAVWDQLIQWQNQTVPIPNKRLTLVQTSYRALVPWGPILTFPTTYIKLTKLTFWDSKHSHSILESFLLSYRTTSLRRVQSMSTWLFIASQTLAHQRWPMPLLQKFQNFSFHRE